MYSGASRDTAECADDVKRDVWENFKAYGLPVPELLRLDNHLLHRHYQFKGRVDGDENDWMDIEMFDAILTDPPYRCEAF